MHNTLHQGWVLIGVVSAGGVGVVSAGDVGVVSAGGVGRGVSIHLGLSVSASDP